MPPGALPLPEGTLAAIHTSVGKPRVVIEASDPLSAELLEHWAAKLYLRAGPGDTNMAVEAKRAAEAFRAWQAANP